MQEIVICLVLIHLISGINTETYPTPPDYPVQSSIRVLTNSKRPDNQPGKYNVISPQKFDYNSIDQNEWNTFSEVYYQNLLNKLKRGMENGM